jgi:hypothetical protein
MNLLDIECIYNLSYIGMYACVTFEKWDYYVNDAWLSKIMINLS